MTPPETISPEQLTGCRIVIVDEVRLTRSETFSPQTCEEAIDNHGHVRAAVGWLNHCELLEFADAGFEALAVSIHRGANSLTIRWHVIDDQIEAAAIALKEVLSGSWRAYQ